MVDTVIVDGESRWSGLGFALGHAEDGDGSRGQRRWWWRADLVSLDYAEREVVAWFRGGGLEGAGDVVGAEGVVARKTRSSGRLGKSRSHVDCCVVLGCLFGC